MIYVRNDINKTKIYYDLPGEQFEVINIVLEEVKSSFNPRLLSCWRERERGKREKVEAYRSRGMLRIDRKVEEWKGTFRKLEGEGGCKSGFKGGRGFKGGGRSYV